MPADNLGLFENNESPLKQITENMQIMISQVSIEGIYKYVSSSHKIILGYEPQDLFNKSIFDVIHPDDILKVKIAFIKGLIYGYFDKTDYRYRCADGRYFMLETVGNIVRDEEGFICGAVFASTNVSASKKFEKELVRLDQLRLVGEMAASLAHEIRNPMTTVRSFLQLLADKEECRENIDYFNIMIEEIDAADAIIGQFLNMAKDKPVNYAMQDLNYLIKAIYPLISADAIKSDKQIILELEDVPELYIDAKEINQLILNLVRNGMESMEAGGILTIRTIHAENQVILAIEDQGHGIAADIMDKIGTPFFTTKELGTGLGLAICYSIAARNNAAIEINSNRQGSIFSVVFKTSNASNDTCNSDETKVIEQSGLMHCVS